MCNSAPLADVLDHRSKAMSSSKGKATEPYGVVVGHPCSDTNTIPQGTPKNLDVPACVSILFPKGANAAVCAGVDALPADIIKGFDALVRALKDKGTIQDDPDIKTRLEPVQDACDRILKDIKEADKSHDKRFPDGTKTDVDKAKECVNDLYLWAWKHVPDDTESAGAMTKQAKIQVVPYIVALAIAIRIRVISQLVKRDMTSLEYKREKYLSKACKIVDDFMAVVQLALEGLMADTSLVEVALDYEVPIALYLMLMTRFRASMDVIKSPSARPRDMTAFDDGLSSIREILHWKPSRAGDQAQGRTIELKNLNESLWWARFTDTDFEVAQLDKLRASIEIHELSHVLGAGGDDIAHTLALKPGQKSALLQLPPASALRSTLCATMAHACQGLAAPPPTFARTNKPPPPGLPPAAMPPKSRSHWPRWLSRPSKMEERLSAAAPRTLSGHTDYVHSVAVYPDSDRVLSASADRTVRVWSLSSGQHLRTLSGHTLPVLCMAASPDGKMAVTGGFDKSVRVWSVESGSSIAQHTLQGHSDWVCAVAVSPDGRSIASGGKDKTVKLWYAESGLCHGTLSGHSDHVYCLAFSPDGSTLISGSRDKSIRVWNMRTRVLERSLQGHSDAVSDVAMTPDGRRVVSSSADCTVRVWKLSSGKEEMKFEGHSGAVKCVAVFSDGERIASGSWDQMVRVWNVRSKALELTLTGHSEGVQSVAVSPDGRSVVSGSKDKTIKVWDLSEGAHGAAG